MSRRTIGILTGILGSAVGAWWWARQRAASNRELGRLRERGTVIFDNTPTTAPEAAL